MKLSWSCPCLFHFSLAAYRRIETPGELNELPTTPGAKAADVPEAAAPDAQAEVTAQAEPLPSAGISFTGTKRARPSERTQNAIESAPIAGSCSTVPFLTSHPHGWPPYRAG